MTSDHTPTSYLGFSTPTVTEILGSCPMKNWASVLGFTYELLSHRVMAPSCQCRKMALFCGPIRSSGLCHGTGVSSLLPRPLVAEFGEFGGKKESSVGVSKLQVTNPQVTPGIKALRVFGLCLGSVPPGVVPSFSVGHSGRRHSLVPSAVPGFCLHCLPWPQHLCFWGTEVLSSWETGVVLFSGDRKHPTRKRGKQCLCAGLRLWTILVSEWEVWGLGGNWQKRHSNLCALISPPPVGLRAQGPG